MPMPRRLLCNPLLIIAYGPALADMQEGLHIGGFVTIGPVYSDSRDADFRSADLFYQNGAGSSNQLISGIDSKFGLQMEAH